jgi:hypothetical protein
VDGRGQVARLTDDGLHTLAAAYPSHLRSVRKRVMSHLGGLDLIAFTKAMEAIAEEGGVDPVPWSARLTDRGRGEPPVTLE